MSRILIIEDEEAIAELEKDYLELSDFEVIIENDGTKGLDRALHEDYDLFILDLMLPGVDGFEICKEIRKAKNTPIIMVSAKKDDIDKIRGLGLGADDYMTKPFSPSELVARVKAHLARYERLIGTNPNTNEVIEIRDDDEDEYNEQPIRAMRPETREDQAAEDEDIDLSGEYGDIDDITDIDSELGDLEPLSDNIDDDFADFEDPLADIDDDDIQ